MKTNKRFNIILMIGFMAIFLLLSCNNKEGVRVDSKIETAEIDPLSSWNEGEVKSSIIAYLNEVTDPNNTNFVPVQERIATIDNDGTLMSEKPLYFQFYFALDRIKEQVQNNPELAKEEPYKSIINDDIKGILKSGEKELMEVVMKSHSNLSKSEFETIVNTWMENAIHPTKNKPFKELYFQPMIELIHLLQDNQFEVFIVSGGGIDFVRAWSEERYNIPKHQVIGSSLKSEYNYNDGNPIITKLTEVDLIDDKAGKPIGIDRYIGRKPVFAVGNSDGDLDMLRWTDSNIHQTFKMFIHHTDQEREWAYDKESMVGRFDMGLVEAREKGWKIVDMKNDWKIIYPSLN